MRLTKRWPCLVALAGTLVLGCSGPPAPTPKAAPASNEEARVRECFEELQAALKAGDADKLWALLDPKSQADAEVAAKLAHTAYAAASPEEQAKMQKDLGLSGPELLALSGKTYLKTERFRGKFHEVPESKI